MSAEMARVLFVYRNLLTFVEQDRQILESAFEVEPLRAKGPVSHSKIVAAVRQNDVVFVWFGNWWAAMAAWAARKFGKPCIIVAGGYDAANVPEIKYGLMRHWLLGPISRYGFRTATHVLSVSESTRNELQRACGIDSEVLYNSVDANKFVPGMDKEAIAVTIGPVVRRTARKKGVEYFVKASQHLSDVQFEVIGKCDRSMLASLRRHAGENVHFLGYIPHDQIVERLQRAAVYVQASWHESFGVAVAEAMACECTPVVTHQAALPEVVGETGVYVPVADPKALALGICQALAQPTGSIARQRIVRHFPIERRRQRLVSLIASVA